MSATGTVTACSLGAAATKGVSTSVTSGDANLVTGDAVYKAINTLDASVDGQDFTITLNGKSTTVTLPRKTGTALRVVLTTDGDASAISGVLVTVSNSSYSYTGTSDSSGVAVVQVEQPGTYTVSATAPRYYTATSPSVDLTSESSIALSVNTYSLTCRWKSGGLSTSTKTIVEDGSPSSSRFYVNTDTYDDYGTTVTTDGVPIYKIKAYGNNSYSTYGNSEVPSYSYLHRISSWNSTNVLTDLQYWKFTSTFSGRCRFQVDIEYWNYGEGSSYGGIYRNSSFTITFDANITKNSDSYGMALTDIEIVSIPSTVSFYSDSHRTDYFSYDIGEIRCTAISIDYDTLPDPS